GTLAAPETTLADRPRRLHRPPARGFLLGPCRPGAECWLHAGTNEGGREEGDPLLWVGHGRDPRRQTLVPSQRRLVRRDVEVLDDQRRDRRRGAEPEGSLLRTHARPVSERAEIAEAGGRRRHVPHGRP